MQESDSSKKTNKLKVFDVQRVRGQNSLQKYKYNGVQNKNMYQMYLGNNKRKQNPSSKNKNLSAFLLQNSSSIPIIKQFQRKIRQAIDVRYQKSKLKEFKYQKIKNTLAVEQNLMSYCQGNIETESQDESMESKDFEQLKQFIFLKNERFINIHKYHALKNQQKPQQKIIKQNVRKRRLKLIKTQDQSFQKYYAFDPIQNDLIQKELTTITPKNITSNKGTPRQNLLFLESQIKRSNKKLQTIDRDRNTQLQKRKSLTAREKKQNIRTQIQLSNTDLGFQQIHQKKDNKALYSTIRDTFKLKNQTKFTKYKQNPQNLLLRLDQTFSQQQKNQKSARSLNKGRRFLLQKNNKQKNLQIQPITQTYKNQSISSMVQRQNKKIATIRKIYTETIEADQQPKTPLYTKTTKNRSKFRTQKPTFSRNQTKSVIQETQPKIPYSTSEQKWKLQQISFKFKPVSQKKLQVQIKEMDSLVEQRQKALKLGLSLQKAYSKLLSGRKGESKQINLMNNKKTIVPSESKKIYTAETYMNKYETQQKQRSISKNKRRKLRLRTQNEQLDKTASLGRSIHKNMQTNKGALQFNIGNSINMAILESGSKESLNNQRQKERKDFIVNYRRNNKVQRFSTIS